MTVHRTLLLAPVSPYHPIAADLRQQNQFGFLCHQTGHIKSCKTKQKKQKQTTIQFTDTMVVLRHNYKIKMKKKQMVKQNGTKTHKSYLKTRTRKEADANVEMTEEH